MNATIVLRILFALCWFDHIIIISICLIDIFFNAVLLVSIHLYSGDTFGAWNCDLICLCLSCCVNRLFYFSLL